MMTTSFRAGALRPILATAMLALGACAGAPVEEQNFQLAAEGQQLYALTGSGEGIANITTTHDTVGFGAQITINVHGAAPHTTLTASRAPEVFRPLTSDGICQRAAGDYPWNGVDYPVAPAFTTFISDGAPVTLTTNSAGSGSVHFDLDVPAVPDGTVFDVMVRLVGADTELRTDCFTVNTK
jgi:hypothetical protein